MRSGLACALSLAVALSPAPVLAEPEVPTKNQALLLLRTLAFDRNLKVRSGRTARVCVLYKAHHPASEKARVELTTSLGDLARTTVVSGLPVEVTAIAWEGGDQLRRRLRDARHAAIFVAPGLGDELEQILAATRASSALTFTAAEEYVRHGVSVGLVSRNARPLLLVHLKSSRKEGARLDSNLLRISEVIR